jgi:hypothetical protein
MICALPKFAVLLSLVVASICSMGIAGTTCPGDFAWLTSATRWTKEGHDLGDLDELRSLVRQGYISEGEAHDVVDHYNLSPIEKLLDRKDFYNSEMRLVSNRMADAFSKPMYGELIGKPVQIDAGRPTRAMRRRSQVLLQKSTGSEDEDRLSFVLLDPQSNRVIASTEYDYDSGSKTIKITWVGVYKPERGQGYSDLLFQQILSHHPKTKKIVTIFGGDNLKIYNDALAAGKSKEDALTLTPAYKSRMKLGFKEMHVDVGEWDSIELTAIRP